MFKAIVQLWLGLQCMHLNEQHFYFKGILIKCKNINYEDNTSTFAVNMLFLEHTSGRGTFCEEK